MIIHRLWIQRIESTNVQTKKIKRDVTRDLLPSSLRQIGGLNRKDRWCNYHIMTRRPRGNTKDRYRSITLHKERSLIFPLSANLSGYGNVGISMRLRFIVPLLPSGAVSALREAACTAKASTSLCFSLLFFLLLAASFLFYLCSDTLSRSFERASSLSEARRSLVREKSHKDIPMKENDRQ